VFMFAVRNAPVRRVDLDPGRIGGIGHLGYFRQHAEPLWRDALDWFLGTGGSRGQVESMSTRQELTGVER